MKKKTRKTPNKKHVVNSISTFTIEDDKAWADVHRQIDEDCDKRYMADMDAWVAWRLGLAAFEAAKKIGAKWLHD